MRVVIQSLDPEADLVAGVRCRLLQTSALLAVCEWPCQWVVQVDLDTSKPSTLTKLLSYADSPPDPELLGVVIQDDDPLLVELLGTVTDDGRMPLVMLTSRLEWCSCLAVILWDQLGCWLAEQKLWNWLRLVECDAICALTQGEGRQLVVSSPTWHCSELLTAVWSWLLADIDHTDDVITLRVLSLLTESEHRATLGTLVILLEIIVSERFPDTESAESICLNDVDEDWTHGAIHWLDVLVSFSGKLSSNLPILFRNCALYALKHSNVHRQCRPNDWQVSIHF